MALNVVEKIDKLRLERGWSVNNLAMEAMLTQSTVNNIFTRKAEPKISTLRNICEAFGMTLAEFFMDEDNPETCETELTRRIRNLSKAQKSALLVLLRSLK